MCAMFNIIKKTVFLFGIFFFIFSSTRAATSLFEEARQECRGIYQSSIASEEDAQQWAEMNLATLSTLEEQEIVDLARTQCPPSYLEKTIPQMREGLQTFFNNALNSAQQNIKSYHVFLESLGSLTPETIEHHYLVPRLDSVRACLQDRTQRSTILPRTLPSDMETHSPYNKKLAEDAILRRANEALAIKVFGRTLPHSQLEKIFNPFVSHEVYGGHFLVLHAYVLDLIPSPPLPDHYQYRVSHNLVQALRDNPLAAFVVPGAVKEAEKARAQLAGPLKEIQELELSARTRLKRYKENQITAEDILMEKVLAILTSTITDEVYAEAYKHAVKAEKRKERKKAAERRKKQQAREAKLRALSQSIPEADKSAAPASFVDSLAKQAQAGPAEDESFDQLPSAHGTQSALPLQEASPEDSSSESEEAEEAFEYKPFVKQHALQSASSTAGTESSAAGTSAAASASILTLKPRIYKIWEDFWSPGIRWMEWDDFTQLFMHQKLGFGIRPVGGSVRHISYPFSLLPSRTGKDHFMVHEPHGRTTLGPSTLRNIRSQLAEDLGWSEETFQSE